MMKIYQKYQTENNCYKAATPMKPVNILVNSTGADNANLKRYVDYVEIRVGGGGQSWRMMWNDGESYIMDDHFRFLNKTEGLITSNRITAAECSAYIVYGQPTSGGYVSSIIIPSAIATNYTWQIADETNYIKFTIDSNGNASKTGGSSSSGNVIGVYSIR